MPRVESKTAFEELHYLSVIFIHILVNLLELNIKFNLFIEDGEDDPFGVILVEYTKEEYSEISEVEINKSNHKERKMVRCIRCQYQDYGTFNKNDLNDPDENQPFCLRKCIRGFKNNLQKMSPEGYDSMTTTLCTNAKCVSDNVFNQLAVGEDSAPDELLEVALQDFSDDFRNEFTSASPEDIQGSCKDFFDSFKFWATESAGEVKKTALDSLAKLYDGPLVQSVYHNLNEIFWETLRRSTSSDDDKERSLTHVRLMNLERELIKEYNGQVWHRAKDPVTDFCGMEEPLRQLKACRNIGVVIGPEGVGKTQLARKFAFENQYDHCVFIDAQSEYAIKESFCKLAFEKLRIRDKDDRGRKKGTVEIQRDVCQYFEGTNTIFIFDNATKDIRLTSDYENYYVLITSREDVLNFGGKIQLNGFTTEEAVRYIKKRIPGEQMRDVRDLARNCVLNPKKICKSLEVFKTLKQKSGLLKVNYSLKEFLSNYKFHKPQ